MQQEQQEQYAASGKGRLFKQLCSKISYKGGIRLGGHGQLTVVTVLAVQLTCSADKDLPNPNLKDLRGRNILSL